MRNQPQCTSLHSLLPLRRTMTGMLGKVSGATLKRCVYFGRSRSRFQQTPDVTKLEDCCDSATHLLCPLRLGPKLYDRR
jgi:hypothetical protein